MADFIRQPELRTDISGTIDFAAALARTAPHPARRVVINVLANGTDNVAEDPRAARPCGRGQQRGERPCDRRAR